MSEFLHGGAAHLEARLNKYKGQMLDHKPFSIKNTFKLFGRVDHVLKSVVDLDHPESVFISSNLAQSILLEVVDTFLAHIYDQQIKANLILSLVSDAYNPMCQRHDQGQVDP